jgi:hypothetical protein
MKKNTSITLYSNWLILCFTVFSLLAVFHALMALFLLFFLTDLFMCLPISALIAISLLIFFFYCRDCKNKMCIKINSDGLIYTNTEILFKNIMAVYYWTSFNCGRYPPHEVYHLTFYMNNQQVIHVFGFSQKDCCFILNKLKKDVQIYKEEPLAKTTEELLGLNERDADVLKNKKKTKK